MSVLPLYAYVHNYIFINVTPSAFKHFFEFLLLLEEQYLHFN